MTFFLGTGGESALGQVGGAGDGAGPAPPWAGGVVPGPGHLPAVRESQGRLQELLSPGAVAQEAVGTACV